MSDARLLVVAGEASGDRAAAAVVRALGDVSAFGFGGGALRAAGVELLGDLRYTTALGVTETLGRAYDLLSIYRKLVASARDRRPRAALLVNYTEFNLCLAGALRPLGIRILWYGAPQIWAWRKGRARTLRGRVDRLCVLLPFEEPLWREEGVDATYVGHPAMEAPLLGRDQAREELGLTNRAWAIALLPGSRPHEVRSLLQPMLVAYERVRHERASIDGRVFLAPSLDPSTLSWAVDACASAKLEIVHVDATEGLGSVLPAFDVALCASGTVALEAAIANAVPVVAYRVSLGTELVARALVRTPYYALPNVLLGRRAFDELLQRDAEPRAMEEAVTRALKRRDEALIACAEIVDLLDPGRKPSAAVARILRPWLGL